MTETKNGRQIHALVLLYPIQGHINPMLQFSIITNFLSKSMLHISKSSIHFETISDGHDGRGDGVSPETYDGYLRVSGSASLSRLIKKLGENGRHVDVLVYDSFLTWGLDVAKDCGGEIRTAAFFTQACAVNSLYFHVSKGILPVPFPDGLISLPGVPELQPREVPYFLYKYDSYPAFREMLVKQFCNLDQADWVLLNIFDKLEFISYPNFQFYI